jgi:hypothetical protein
MASARKRLTKAVSALAATGVVQQVVRKAASDPRVRRKADEVKTAVRDRAMAAGKTAAKKIRLAGKSAGKSASAMAKAAGKRLQKSVVGPARKSAGKRIQGLGKKVAG